MVHRERPQWTLLGPLIRSTPRRSQGSRLGARSLGRAPAPSQNLLRPSAGLTVVFLHAQVTRDDCWRKCSARNVRSLLTTPAGQPRQWQGRVARQAAVIVAGVAAGVEESGENIHRSVPAAPPAVEVAQPCPCRAGAGVIALNASEVQYSDPACLGQRHVAVVVGAFGLTGQQPDQHCGVAVVDGRLLAHGGRLRVRRSAGRRCTLSPRGASGAGHLIIHLRSLLLLLSWRNWGRRFPRTRIAGGEHRVRVPCA